MRYSRYSVPMVKTQREPTDATAISARHVLAENLASIRARVGMASAQELADKVKELGGRLDRAAIAKIESKTRNVSLDEALLLAAALDVAPVHLIFPLDDDRAVEIASRSQPVPARDAREWLRGREPLPGTNEKLFRSAWIPDSEWGARKARVEKAADEYGDASRQLRVAKAMLRTISDDYGKVEQLEAARSGQLDHLTVGMRPTAPPAPPSQRQMMLERKLSAAYDRVAEATVDEQDAQYRYRDAQVEDGVD